MASRIAWFIRGKYHVLGFNRKDDRDLLPRTKRGVPSGSLEFPSKKWAQDELDGMRRWGPFPHFAENASVEQITFYIRR